VVPTRSAPTNCSFARCSYPFHVGRIINKTIIMLHLSGGIHNSARNDRRRTVEYERTIARRCATGRPRVELHRSPNVSEPGGNRHRMG